MRIGPFEILLIAVVIFGVIGSKNLPKLGTKAGGILKEVKDNSKDITETVKLVKDEVKDIKHIIINDGAEKIIDEESQ